MSAAFVMATPNTGLIDRALTRVKAFEGALLGYDVTTEEFESNGGAVLQFRIAKQLVATRVVVWVLFFIFLFLALFLIATYFGGVFGILAVEKTGVASIVLAILLCFVPLAAFEIVLLIVFQLVITYCLTRAYRPVDLRFSFGDRTLTVENTLGTKVIPLTDIAQVGQDQGDRGDFSSERTVWLVVGILLIVLVGGLIGIIAGILLIVASKNDWRVQRLFVYRKSKPGRKEELISIFVQATGCGAGSKTKVEASMTVLLESICDLVNLGGGAMAQQQQFLVPMQQVVMGMPQPQFMSSTMQANQVGMTTQVMVPTREANQVVTSTTTKMTSPQQIDVMGDPIGPGSDQLQG